MMAGQGSWAVGVADLQHLDRMLLAFVAETQACSVLLIDRTGRYLTGAGDVDALDATSFASLAAADFAASDQLARLLGESEFAALYHAAPAQSMYLADIDGQAILAALFDARTTLGLVRLRTRTLVPRIARVFQELTTRPPAADAAMDDVWLASATDEIDRLFTD